MNPPSDLELMMYADGELPEARATEVARFLERTDGAENARAKLYGMSLVGDAVRDQTSRLATVHAADGIAALVMKAVDAENADAGASSVTGKLRASAEAASGPRSDSSVSASSASRSGNAARPLPVGASKPANDNNRLIYGLAALAAAAAVMLGVWGRTAPAPEASDREPVVMEVPPPALSSPLVLSTSNAEARVDGTAQPDGSSEKLDDASAAAEASVKVASVDFGTKTGTVYYVPKDTPGATTAVVWLADE